MKKLLDIKGVSKITRKEQKDIKGGQFWGVFYKTCYGEIVYQGRTIRMSYSCIYEDQQRCNPVKNHLWCVA